MSRTIIIKTGFALVCVILVGGCSLFNPMSSLYGTWVNTSTTSGYSYTWQFNSDETFSNTTVGGGYTDILSGTYSGSYTTFSISITSFTENGVDETYLLQSYNVDYTWAVNSSTLTVTNSNGSSEQYTKSGSGGGTSGGTTAFGFWSDVGNEGTITIYVNGTSVGGLTHYFSSQPSWGSYGMLIVNEPPGTYTLSATSQGSTYWPARSVTLNSGEELTYEFQ